MAVSGCAPLLDYRHRNAVVFDIGGGSTELMWLKLRPRLEPELLGWISLPCGVVTMAERWAGVADAETAWRGMVDEVAARIAPFEATWKIGEQVGRGGVQMLGTSGTVTTIAGVLLDLDRYDRDQVDGRWLDFEDIAYVSHELMLAPLADRAGHPCIGASRADLVVPGCAILEAIRDTWPVGRLRVADRGVREGLLLGLMQEADREAGARG